MKYMKFQQDLLKAADARDWRNKAFNYPWFETEDKIIICPEGHYIMAIWKGLFYLDKEKIFKGKAPFNGEYLINPDNLETAVDTHSTVTLTGLKKCLHKFTVGEESVFLDENNLKYFDLNSSTFKGTNRKSPIYIYENEEMVGAVLPVNYMEAE